MPKQDTRDVVDLICDYGIEIEWHDLDVYANGNSLARVGAFGHPNLVFCMEGRRRALETLVHQVVENIEAEKRRRTVNERTSFVESLELGTDSVLDKDQRQVDKLSAGVPEESKNTKRTKPRRQ